MGVIFKRPIFFCFFNSLVNLKEEQIEKITKSIALWNNGKIFALYTPQESELYRVSIQTKASLFLKSGSYLASARQCFSVRDELRQLIEKTHAFNEIEKKEKTQRYEYFPMVLIFSHDDLERFQKESPDTSLFLVCIGEKEGCTEHKSKCFSSIEDFVSHIPFL